MTTIRIHSKTHKYQANIDDNLSILIEKFIPSDKSLYVIIDSNLPDEILNNVKKKNSKVIVNKLTGGEEIKSLETYSNVLNHMLENNISKSHLILAIGGGTILDLAGYIAATYKRGIPYISIPTTTLAMIDVCIGGKTALNSGNIKNAAGMIYPPVNVLVGLDTLSTLPKEHFNNGLFEALKMGIIKDRELYKLFKNETLNIKEIIIKSLKVKRYYIEKDELDQGLRKQLNFGHTIGHALELTNNLLHGEAVANGILIMLNKTPIYSEIKKIIASLGCKPIESINIDEITNLILNDKKAKNGKIEMIYTSKIGSAYIKETSIEEVKGILESYVI